MSKADIFILVITLIGAYHGYKEGFLMELFSLVGIVLGIFAGFKLMGEGMIYLQNHFNADDKVLPYISFIVIFLIVVILVTLLGRLIKHSADKSFLGKVDQAMGLLLGTIRTLFMISIALWIVDSLQITLKSEWVEDSWLYPFTARMAPGMASWIGNFIPPFKEIFTQF